VIFLLFYVSAFAFYSAFIVKNLRRGTKIEHNSFFCPSVSIIICAYNESKTIAKKIENTLKIDYSRSKLEIIAFDNGSTDNTFEIATQYEKDGVKVYRLGGKNTGKSAGLNVAFERAKNEIVAITDVDCLLKADVLVKSVPYFADPSVGAVTGSQILLNVSESSNTEMESCLQDFYKIMHEAESSCDSTIVYNGEFTAFRKQLIKKLDEDVGADDTQIAIKVKEAGFRALFLEEANFYEYAPSTFGTRWKQKVRRSAQLVQALVRYRSRMFRKSDVYSMIIYPWNFFMYVISPFVLAFLSLFLIFLLILDFWATMLLIALIATALALVLVILHLLFKKDIKAVPTTVATFLLAQLALLIGSISLLRRNPFKWEPLDEMRRY
jgi:cellulose synthase/poly-beta-1,6-N-acetylglucosamine synthase-like glycosyltransferase